MPLLSQHAAPLAVAQARRPRPVEDSDTEDLAHVRSIKRSQVVASNSSRSSMGPGRHVPREVTDPTQPRMKRPTSITTTRATESGIGRDYVLSHDQSRSAQRRSIAITKSNAGFSSTSSLPDQRKGSAGTGSLPVSPGIPKRPSELVRRHSHAPRPTPSSMSASQKVRTLRQNYFRSETLFLTALEGISSRLIAIPKPARLSALRAELALVARDLPAEVDVPLICPPTLIEGTASRSMHHRIVRLNPAEATSLNSAEKVPYLLMLEVLKEDFDFNHGSEENQRLLAEILSEKGRQRRRRLFDTSDATRVASTDPYQPGDAVISDSVLEPTNGDLSSPALLQTSDTGERTPIGPSFELHHGALEVSSNAPSGINVVSAGNLPVPRNSDGLTRQSNSFESRASPSLRLANANASDVSALADHMRTASQMLAQLEMSAAKRPKTEVAAIRAKIIASMQTLEEQSFSAAEGVQAPNFDTIIAKVNEETPRADIIGVEEDELDSSDNPKLNSSRGADRMENDAKTGGIQRKGDRDDPSAATFGEAWEQIQPVWRLPARSRRT